MGYYINQINGKLLPTHNKADFLIENGATIVEGKVEFQENLVCVVENFLFDAAGYIYSNFELEEFNNPYDKRPKTWLIVPDAAKLAGYK